MSGKHPRGGTALSKSAKNLIGRFPAKAKFSDFVNPGAEGQTLQHLFFGRIFEHVQLELHSKPGRIGGQRGAGIARRGRQNRGAFFLTHQGNGQAGKAILVGTGGILAFQLEIEVAKTQGGTQPQTATRAVSPSPKEAMLPRFPSGKLLKYSHIVRRYPVLSRNNMVQIY